MCSQQAYYHGVVLVRCPGCNNLHLFADRLGYFEDDPIDVEQILKEKGESFRRISYGQLSGLQAASGVVGSNSGEPAPAVGSPPMVAGDAATAHADDESVARNAANSTSTTEKAHRGESGQGHAAGSDEA